MFLAPHLFGMSAILVLPMVPKAREAGPHKHNHHSRHEKAAAELHAHAGHRNSHHHSNGHVHKDTK